MLFEKILLYYQKGYYRKKHILALHRAKVLTDTECSRILESGSAPA